MNLLLPTLRAALFDLDGTLVRTAIDFARMRREIHALARTYNAAPALAGEDDILEQVVRLSRAVTVAQGAEAGEAVRDAAYEALAHIEAEGCAAPEPIAGASDLLRDLRARGVRVAVVTRNCRGVAADLTRRMDLPHDALVAREDTAEFKPHPAPLFAACKQLAVAPVDTVMVGDLWADIAAGRAAGVGATIGIQWPHDPPGRFHCAPPDVEVNNFAGVVRLLTGR